MLCFACYDFVSGVPLQADALSNLHFFNQIFRYWRPTRSISCRAQPCGFSCICGEQCLCSAGRMLLQRANPTLCVLGVPGVSVSPQRGGTVQPRAWSCLPGTVCPAGWGGRLWPLESRKASGALLCSRERRWGSRDSSALAPSSPASVGSQHSCWEMAAWGTPFHQALCKEWNQWCNFSSLAQLSVMLYKSQPDSLPLPSLEYKFNECTERLLWCQQIPYFSRCKIPSLILSWCEKWFWELYLVVFDSLLSLSQCTTVPDEISCCSALIFSYIDPQEDVKKGISHPLLYVFEVWMVKIVNKPNNFSK